MVLTTSSRAVQSQPHLTARRGARVKRQLAPAPCSGVQHQRGKPEQDIAWTADGHYRRAHCTCGTCEPGSLPMVEPGAHHVALISRPAGLVCKLGCS